MHYHTKTFFADETPMMMMTMASKIMTMMAKAAAAAAAMAAVASAKIVLIPGTILQLCSKWCTLPHNLRIFAHLRSCIDILSMALALNIAAAPNEQPFGPENRINKTKVHIINVEIQNNRHELKQHGSVDAHTCMARSYMYGSVTADNFLQNITIIESSHRHRSRHCRRTTTSGEGGCAQ